MTTENEVQKPQDDETPSMTPRELRQYILKHMSAEEALLKLLEGDLINYQYLKFKDNETTHPMIIVAAAGLEMGWDLVLLNENPETEVKGFIIGTREYVNETVDKLARMDELDRLKTDVQKD